MKVSADFECDGLTLKKDVKIGSALEAIKSLPPQYRLVSNALGKKRAAEGGHGDGEKAERGEAAEPRSPLVLPQGVEGGEGVGQAAGHPPAPRARGGTAPPTVPQRPNATARQWHSTEH